MYERYEYKVIPVESVLAIIEVGVGETPSKTAVRFEDWLNTHGEEGWQFVGKVGKEKEEGALCFMREKREPR